MRGSFLVSGAGSIMTGQTVVLTARNGRKMTCVGVASRSTFRAVAPGIRAGKLAALICRLASEQPLRVAVRDALGLISGNCASQPR